MKFQSTEISNNHNTKICLQKYYNSSEIIKLPLFNITKCYDTCINFDTIINKSCYGYPNYNSCVKYILYKQPLTYCDYHC